MSKSVKAVESSSRVLISMGACYAMGTFNDNLFKQAALLLAASAKLGMVQGVATICFALPFVAFSAWGGWLADRRSKSSIVIWSKLLELAAMLLGVWAFWQISWVGMIVVVFLMGLQSTFFSPALNGAIPEMFAAERVPRVNSLLKMWTTVTILLGIALGGVLLDFPAILPAAVTFDGLYGSGRFVVGVLGVAVAVSGAIAALGIRSRGQVMPSSAPFPWLGPLDSLRHAFLCKKADPVLFLALMGEAFFYGTSSFVLLCINNLGVQQLGLSVGMTSLLSVALSVGVCVGALIAGRHEAAIWRRLMMPAGCGMVTGLILASLVIFLPVPPAWTTACLIGVFAVTGACAGLYLIPIVSSIQLRPAETEKGKILGISNFASFSAIILAGLTFALFEGMPQLRGRLAPSTLLAVAGVSGLGFMGWVAFYLRKIFPYERYSPLGTFLRLLLSLRYRVTTSGLDTLNIRGPVLFLPNHPGLIDPFIVYSQLAGFSPRPLVDEKQLSGLHGRLVARLLDAVTIPDVMKEGQQAVTATQQSIHVILESLRAGNHVLMYPSGRIYHSSRENIGGNSGAWSLIQQAPGVQVVLVRTSGLWGSSFSFAPTGRYPHFFAAMLRGVKAVLGNLLFFTPRRMVYLEFVEATGLADISDRRELNRRLEDFYNETAAPAIGVPMHFWQGSVPYALPEQHVHRDVHDTSDVHPDVRKCVNAILRASAGLSDDQPVYDSMSLSSDLGLDSLMLMEVVLELESCFGHTMPPLEKLQTVADCLLAASGLTGTDEVPEVAPDAWFSQSRDASLMLPKNKSSIVGAFIAQLRRDPDSPLLAERGSMRSRSDIFLGAVIIAERLKRLPGTHLGIMMPSVPAVVVVWLAALLAGKVPVFFNWTVGEANLRHCIALSGVRHMIGVSQLTDRLQRQGLALDALPVEWHAIDKMAASFSRVEKLKGFLKARFMRDERHFAVPETAGVLFTSGSESFPKAVPLTHDNLLTNAVDIIHVLNLSPDDSVLAMLPPFHSFGLMVGLVIPLATGIRVVFHPNPAEPAMLNGLIRDYRISLLAMPPTFLNAMLEQAKGSARLSSIKYAFVGAEKCPDHVYRAFAEQCPEASLCEGYGITECSPAVSVNRPGQVVPGTIGPLLPSVEGVVVRESDDVITGRASTGETGMLLVRGPSIFHGYLGDSPSPFVEFEGVKWYRTGDLVSMDASGRLTFMGRLKRFVKIGGEMISLPQIENVLFEAYGHLADGEADGVALAIEATPEDAGSEIVLFTPLDLSLPRVNATLREAGLSLLYNVKRIEKIDSIPLLGSGKTDYRSLKAMLA